MTSSAEISGDMPSFESPVAPIAGCLLVCGQCEAIAGMLTVEHYTMRHDENASIGEHLRHSVEHFTVLLDGLGLGIIDYDNRKRNSDLERCPLALISAVRAISAQFLLLAGQSMTTPLEVRMLFAPNTEKLDVPSTLGRELGFVASHAIHHIAIVKLLMQSLGASLPREYGVGHATMLHRQDPIQSLAGA
jgi:uncharacterized damage-inducible protein DinB